MRVPDFLLDFLEQGRENYVGGNSNQEMALLTLATFRVVARNMTHVEISDLD